MEAQIKRSVLMKELPNPTFALSPLNLPRGSLHPAQSNSAVDFLPRRAKSAIEVSWAKHQDEVRDIILEGSRCAREEAGRVMGEVRRAMNIAWS